MSRAVLALGLILGLALAGCAAGPYDGLSQPRTLHVAPDGALVVTDLGTGHGDGRVVAVEPGGGRRTLLAGLPSTRGSGQQYADLAGPSGADVAPDGTVCAAIGDASAEGRGFGTLRCSDGMVVDLEGFERRANPDRRGRDSNPYDTVSDRHGGWYVSDAAANDVLHVDPGGRVEVAALFASLAPLGGRDAQAVPTGLSLAPDGRVLVALLGGAPFGGGTGAVVAIIPGPGPAKVELVARAPFPIAATALAGGRVAVLSLGPTFAAGDGGSLAIVAPGGGRTTVASGLRRPTGLARLDGGWVVTEQDAGRVRALGP